MSKVFCRYCGNLIDEDATFCTHCGKEVLTMSQRYNWGVLCKNIIGKIWELLCMPFLYIKSIKFKKIKGIKGGEWWKRIKKVVITIFIILCLWVIGAICEGIYDEYYLPYYYESLYKEGMNNINKADSIALKLFERGNNKEKAIMILKNSAEKGNVQSMVLLGRYYKGYDIKARFEGDWWSRHPKSLDKCSYWYLQAAKKGNAEAQGELGDNYESGYGVEQDFDKAIYWTKLGADNGDAVAQWRMGNLYFSGVAYYRGDIYSIYDDIGRKYKIWWRNGLLFVARANLNVKRDESQGKFEIEQVCLHSDIKKAKYYWKLAANQGLKAAKDKLEKIYDEDE